MERPLVYKRRPKKSSITCDIDVSTEAGGDAAMARIPNSSENCLDDVVPEFTNVSKKGSHSWIDRSLSSRGRRSSTSSGETFDLSSLVLKWNNSGLSIVGESRFFKGKTNKKPSSGSRKIEPPVEFVQEKQAMFAEIDAFDLESEEESPLVKLKKPQDKTQAQVDMSKVLEFNFRSRKGLLEIVPEDELEEFASESLSAALRTPFSATFHSPKSEKSVQSCTDQDCDRLTRILDFNHEGIPGSPLEEYTFSGSEKLGTPIASEPGQLSSSETGEEEASLDDDVLSAALQSLQIANCFQLNSEEQLNPPAEVSSNEASVGSGERKTDDGTEVLHSGELHLGTDLIPIFGALLKECQQTRPTTLRAAISDFCDISEVVKLGEGTFGEAFKGGGYVFKIVPMDGEFLVNGEVQKTFAEIYSEVLLTNTLQRLRAVNPKDSLRPSNYCTNFIETKRTCICQGSYEVELVQAWEHWDALKASENDHPMIFPERQLYIVFVLADGGTDLESFVLSSFNEARCILLQVVLALGVAEQACGFEHRDLHWGNIVLSRDSRHEYCHYRLLDEDIKVHLCGVAVSIIDFTLSRIDTGKHVFFCNLSADPLLFEGPRDVQSETYRRMLNLTKGNWEGSYPQTNCFWIHYLADTLLNKKSYPSTSQQKRTLRSFCKRVLLYDSATAVSRDDFFRDLWISA